MRKIVAPGHLRVAVAVLLSILSALQLSAQPPKTTIGPPYVPGVPDWVYTHRVSPDLRQRFIVMYWMLYQREQYQQELYPETAAANYKTLAEELVDLFGSFAGKENVYSEDIKTEVPEWVWHIDDEAQIKWLHDRIRQEVFKNNLQDIANSPDLVPSLVPARPTTIGPARERPRLLTHEEVVKLLQNPVNRGGDPLFGPNGKQNDSTALSSSGSYKTQRKALTDRTDQDVKMQAVCTSTCSSCTSGCLAGGAHDSCFASCNAALAQCFNPLQEDFTRTMDAINQLDQKHNGSKP